LRHTCNGHQCCVLLARDAQQRHVPRRILIMYGMLIAAVAKETRNTSR
jgi:hypothetical protein